MDKRRICNSMATGNFAQANRLRPRYRWASRWRGVFVSLSCVIMFGALGCGSKPVPADPKVMCRSPNKPDAEPTPIQQWKFDIVSEAVTTVLRMEPAGLSSAELTKRVTAHVPAKDKGPLGKLEWLTEKVRMELEVRGDLERIKLQEGAFLLRLPNSGGVVTEPSP